VCKNKSISTFLESRRFIKSFILLLRTFAPIAEVAGAVWYWQLACMPVMAISRHFAFANR